MNEKDKKPMKRDEMMRCKHCKKLFPDKDCTLDPILGLICPNGCKPTFEQPPYESPFNDNSTKTNQQKV